MNEENASATAKPRLFINRRIYTDIESWEVLELDEGKGTATVVEVARDFKPQWVPGGFSAICVNIAEQRNAPVVRKRGAEPFAVVRHRGVWGYWTDARLFGCHVSALKPEGIRKFQETPNAVFETDGDGRETVSVYEFTKSGKRKRKFIKLGCIEPRCEQFHDFNF